MDSGNVRDSAGLESTWYFCSDSAQAMYEFLLRQARAEGRMDYRESENPTFPSIGVGWLGDELCSHHVVSTYGKDSFREIDCGGNGWDFYYLFSGRTWDHRKQV